MDEVKTGPYRSLFHPETMITGKEDAANNCKSQNKLHIHYGQLMTLRIQMLVDITQSEKN